LVVSSKIDSMKRSLREKGDQRKKSAASSSAEGEKGAKIIDWSCDPGEEAAGPGGNKGRARAKRANKKEGPKQRKPTARVALSVVKRERSLPKKGNGCV